MARSLLCCAVITVHIMLPGRPAMAGFSIDVYIDNVPAYSVTDNMIGDDNPALGDIEHHFVLTDVQNRWEADGFIFAEGGYNGQPPVSTVVTDTVIEKIANVPLFIGEIDFVHHYAASGLQTHTASIDGVFDNTINHQVGGTSLQYLADINGQSLGAFATGFYTGPGPEPFMGNLGPLVLPTTTEHHMEMRFYLDTLGDSIEMFNSAEIHTVPEPASGPVFLALGAILASRRARARARGLAGT